MATLPSKIGPEPLENTFYYVFARVISHARCTVRLVCDRRDKSELLIPFW